jgi:hypothetical protein
LLRYIYYIKNKFLKLSKNYLKIKQNSNFKNVIISHLVNYENVTFKNDFYFGDFASKINKKNTLIVLIDHIKLKKEKLKKNLKGNYIVLGQNLGFIREINIHIFCIFKFLLSENKIFNLLNYLNFVESQRVFEQIKNILSFYKLKNLIFTFEGHLYESLIVNHVKKKKLNIQTCGYQFGIIKKKQIHTFLNMSKEFIPDKIFTINKHNENLLKHSIKKKSEIINIGYLKNKKNITPYQKKILSKEAKKILVMPEGIPDEINTFLNFCLNHKDKNLNFTLRLHPIFRNNQYLEKLNIKLNENIKFSKNSLFEDFKSHNFILYRGTAAIMDAINHKLIPIYLRKNSEITKDPLFNYNKNHIINEKSKLNNFFKKITSKHFILERKNISLFALNYYKKPNINLIKKNLIK